MEYDQIENLTFKRQVPGFSEQASEPFAHSVGFPLRLFNVLWDGIDQRDPVPHPT